MKRYMIIVICILTTMFLLLTAVSCSCSQDEQEKEDLPDPVGTYKLIIDPEKAPDDKKALAQAMTGMVDMTLTLSSDGKVRTDVVMSVMGQSSSDSKEGTWTQEGHRISITGTESTDSGIPIKTDGEFEISDDKLLIMEEQGSGESCESVEYIYFMKQE